MSRHFVIGIAIAAMAASSLAQAQLAPIQKPGSRITESPIVFPIDRSREILERFVACATAKHPAIAHKLAVDIDSDATGYRKLYDPKCLLENTPTKYGVVQLSITGLSFAYVVADVLVKRNLQDFDTTQIHYAAPLPELKLHQSGEYTKRRTKDGIVRTEPLSIDKRAEQNASIVYGECVVRNDPGRAKKLLWTKVNSEDERAALSELMPALSSCLDQGQTLKANRAFLRGTIALSYYRLAFAPRVSGAIGATR